MKELPPVSDELIYYLETKYSGKAFFQVLLKLSHVSGHTR